MRFIRTLCLSLAYSTTIAVSSTTSGKFGRYLSKSTSSGPLRLDDRTYEDLTAAPRDYTIAVLLTALEAKFGCQLCRDFQPEWELIGKSWKKGDKSGQFRVLYGTLDFADGKGTFQKVIGYSMLFPVAKEGH